MAPTDRPEESHSYYEGYLTPQFAMDLAEYVGCPAGKGIYPEGFLEEAKRPPSVHFEMDDPALKGVCCACYRHGILGRCPNRRCPNPGCGLLMHHSCVMLESPGAPQTCPVCKVEKTAEELHEENTPYWHEAEVGSKISRRLKRSELGPPVFPTENGGGGSVRWPTPEEAQLYGYQTVEEWYLDFTSGGDKRTPQELRAFRDEFVQVENTWRERGARRERVDCVGPPSVKAGSEAQCALGTAETGRMLVQPLQFADQASLVWKRMEEVHSMREILRGSLDAERQESTTGPNRTMPEVLDDQEQEFKQRLLQCQGRCEELRPLIDSAKRLLRATSEHSVVEDKKVSQGYRLHPADGLLEREVQAQRAVLWVPVLLNVALPNEIEKEKTWRRGALERCHMTIMDPPRPLGAT